MSIFDCPGTYDPKPRGAISEAESGLGFRSFRASNRAGSRRTNPIKLSLTVVAFAALVTPKVATAMSVVSEPPRPEGASAVTESLPAHAGATRPERAGVVEAVSTGDDPGRIAQDLLDRARALDASGERLGMRVLMRGIDELLRNGQFTACDRLLTAADVSSMSTRQLLTLLTATLPARDRLPTRSSFFEKVALRMKAERSADAEALLAGLA